MDNQPPTSDPDHPSNLTVVSAAGNDSAAELKAFNAIVSALHAIPVDARPRLIKTVFTFLGYSDIALASPKNSEPTLRSAHTVGSFSEDRSLSAKDFLLQKKPITDIERMVCLAYYLAHYKNTPHFKTLDLSTMNTEAAQVKFANAAGAVENAATAGLLVPAGKGAKQLSAIGELYVQNLPDREAAKAAISHAKPRRKNRRPSANGESKE